MKLRNGKSECWSGILELYVKHLLFIVDFQYSDSFVYIKSTGPLGQLLRMLIGMAWNSLANLNYPVLWLQLFSEDLWLRATEMEIGVVQNYMAWHSKTPENYRLIGQI